MAGRDDVRRWLSEVGQQLRPRRRRIAAGGWTSYAAEPEPKRPWNDPAWTPPEMPSAVAASDEVKLMPDYCCDLPLWYCDWWTLWLSTDLLNALADWQDDFDENFDRRSSAYGGPPRLSKRGPIRQQC